MTVSIVENAFQNKGLDSDFLDSLDSKGWRKWLSHRKMSALLFASACNNSEQRNLSLYANAAFNWEFGEFILTFGFSNDGGLNECGFFSHDGLPLLEQFDRCWEAIQENENDNPLLTFVPKEEDAWEEVRNGIEELSILLGLGK
jgi:hypothetical protein